MENFIKKYSKIIFYLLSIIFLIDVIYLIYVESISLNVLYCPESGFIDCQAVITSQYSKIFGVPLPFFALIYIILIIILYNLKKQYILYLWFLGIAFTVYLLYTEIFFIHHICLYCTIAQIINLLLIIPLYYEGVKINIFNKNISK